MGAISLPLLQLLYRQHLLAGGLRAQSPTRTTLYKSKPLKFFAASFAKISQEIDRAVVHHVTRLGKVLFGASCLSVVEFLCHSLLGSLNLIWNKR
jgi:hypothetical protein